VTSFDDDKTRVFANDLKQQFIARVVQKTLVKKPFWEESGLLPEKNEPMNMITIIGWFIFCLGVVFLSLGVFL